MDAGTAATDSKSFEFFVLQAMADAAGSFAFVEERVVGTSFRHLSEIALPFAVASSDNDVLKWN